MSKVVKFDSFIDILKFIPVHISFVYLPCISMTYNDNFTEFSRKDGRGEGIRTLDTLLTHTRFPSVRLKPLGHPSIY